MQPRRTLQPDQIAALALVERTAVQRGREILQVLRIVHLRAQVARARRILDQIARVDVRIEVHAGRTLALSQLTVDALEVRYTAARLRELMDAVRRAFDGR